jgi:light-regulated signal transduction histidine kinase (bacteriophytochrome)
MNTNGARPQAQATGVQFFGKISAAVSHDLKNVLAVINEKAGLLEDFCQMAQHGKPIDLERIDAVTAQVKGQVRRADKIIRGFNQFAHTTDHPVASIDLNACIMNLVQLAQRLLARLEVNVALQPSAEPVMVTTRPLLAQELIWAVIQWGAEHCAGTREIAIAAQPSDQGVGVRIDRLANLPTEKNCTPLVSATASLRKELAADIQTDRDAGALKIRFTSLQSPQADP